MKHDYEDIVRMLILLCNLRRWGRGMSKCGVLCLPNGEFIFLSRSYLTYCRIVYFSDPHKTSVEFLRTLPSLAIIPYGHNWP